jgi:heparin/heparan-sulfate lyase
MDGELAFLVEACVGDAAMKRLVLLGLAIPWTVGAVVVAAKESPSPLVWKDVQGTKIPVPPAEHPRLYLRAAEAAQLKARWEDPVLQPVVGRLRRMAQQSPAREVEWKALRYLVERDRKAGRATVQQTLELLRATQLSGKQDACRETGRMMVTGAIVYDWLYELLTPEEKKALVSELVRLAKTQECGYPPTKQSSITSHASEAQILRDMLSAGIAVYDEYPEMYELAAGRLLREHVPARNWFYPGHAHHQGASYGPYRFGWDAMALWIFDRLGAGNVFSPEQRYVPYYWLYATRPDGQRLRGGDNAVRLLRGEPWPERDGTLLIASYYGDGYLLGQHLRQNRVEGAEPLFEFLWRDTKLTPQPREDLPRSRYFGPPFGWTIARTGWDEGAVVAEMKVNVYNFNNHQHLDAGAFQLYYRGALAIDSGVYRGSSGEYGSPHCTNYYWRTIAHNGLLIRDPEETFRDDWANEGGQRLPNNRREPRTLDDLLDPAHGHRTGEVLAHGCGPDARTPAYTLLQGDLTAAYSRKVEQVRRSFVFLNLGDPKTPAALIVYDRVVAADPSFRKTWLLHAQEEPQLDGASARVECTQHGDQGRLVLDALLPTAENLTLEKVGGPGKEFWCVDRNYANDLQGKAAAQSCVEPGQWRVEVSPKAPSKVDLFLNVMQVTDRRAPGRLKVERVEAGGWVGCRLQGHDAFWCVLFRRDAEPSRDGLELTVDGQGLGHYLLTDLAPGVWTARRNGAAATQSLPADDDSRAVWFEGPSGPWTIRRQ